ncbi:hypothetical protein IE81DRAFT_342186 [Ceraceosorus guamensis]|uniref:Uncharacterized protein n=1 Tax=Ceraceosorus guamensis TaxID=1522189 RepID=A0A316VUW8_9BASI|nr:hypothetical protein IE81DRAFT_342186 [Ceraceosorus guamensis]PWN41250.1 hypothetical protein IE81DRAFT_342186 [Ceraceosorus guamensis]
MTRPVRQSVKREASSDLESDAKSVSQSEEMAADFVPGEDVLNEPDSPDKKSKKASSSATSTPKGKSKGQSSLPASPSNSKTPASAAAFGDEHWAALSYAMLRILNENSSKLIQYSPELKPWMPKGRILVKMRQSMAGVRGGSIALERYLAEQKGEKKMDGEQMTPQATPSKKRSKMDA